MIYKLNAEDIIWRLNAGFRDMCEDDLTTCLCLCWLPTATGGTLPNWCSLLGRFIENSRKPECTEYDWTKALLEVI